MDAPIAQSCGPRNPARKSHRDPIRYNEGVDQEALPKCQHAPGGIIALEQARRNAILSEFHFTAPDDCLSLFCPASKLGIWRRERDSNPRGAFTPTRFPSVRLQPLGHPSADLARWFHFDRWMATIRWQWNMRSGSGRTILTLSAFRKNCLAVFHGPVRGPARRRFAMRPPLMSNACRVGFSGAGPWPSCAASAGCCSSLPR